MSFATIGQMLRGKNNYHQNIDMANGSPPQYKVDREDTLAPRWWNVREWSKKKLVFTGLGLAILIAVIIIIVVMVEKKNAYPNYSQLTYSLVDQC
jgi:hypothetical protein